MKTIYSLLDKLMTFSVALMALVCAMLLNACGGDKASFSLLPDGQLFKQSNKIFNNKLDILFIIDDSGSMGPYQTNLTNNFRSFIQDFQTKGYDFKIAVNNTAAYRANTMFDNNTSWAKFKDGSGTTRSGVYVITPTTPSLESVFVTNARQGTNGTGDERAFSSFRETLKSPVNAGFLRSDSFLAVIILSDEDDFSGDSRCRTCTPDHSYVAATLDPISVYVNYLDTLTGTTGAARRYNVSNISVTDAACQAQFAATGSMIGQRYMDLTAATNGVSGSLCADFADTLNSIQSRIAELSSQFFLDRMPQVDTIVVKVNGVTVANNTTNGWSYNSTANSIMFHGSAVPPQDSSIQVDFVPVTIRL
jgi:hypothetical protein